MAYTNTNGIIANSNGNPRIIGNKMFKRALDNPPSAPEQVASPVVNVADVYKTKAVFSWTVPEGADNIVVERSTSSDYTGATTLYDGPTTNQIVDMTDLVQNTQYYIRAKAQGAGLADSNWAEKPFKTFWTPTTNTSTNGVGANRIAVQADVDNTTLNPDGHLNVGDYLIVCPNGGAYGSAPDDPWDATIFGANGGFVVPALSSTAKICISGGKGWDYIQLNLVNNPRTAGNPLIITNLGGQVRCRFWLSHAKYVTVTGKYDSTAKTGSSNYLGFAGTDWSNLYGSFGIWSQGNFADANANIVALSGDSHNVKLEYMQIGDGSFAGIVVKEDAQTFSTLTAASTGNVNTFATRTLGSNVTFFSESERIKITLDNVATAKINWIEFVGTGGEGTYRVQVENFDLGNLATIGATSDVDGVSDVQLATATTSNKAYIEVPAVIPPGTYTMSVRIGSTSSCNIIVKFAAAAMDTVEITKCYIHDTNGEGNYIGSTQAAPQQAMQNFNIHDNIFARNGGNGIQIGNMNLGTQIYNNVVMCPGFEWADTFQKFQDQAIQLGARKNTFSFTNNLVVGGNGESFINYIMGPGGGDVVAVGNTATIENNAFLNLRGYMGGFISPQNNFNGSIDFNDNYIGRMGNGTYEELYDTQTRRNYVLYLQSVTSGKVTLNAGGNQYDTSVNTGGSFAVKQAPTTDLTINDAGTNVRNSSVPTPNFSNFMDLPDSYDFAMIERFTTVFSPRWNDTNKQGTKFQTIATANGVPIGTVVINRVYNTGNIVRHQGRFYQSLHDNNFGNTPTGNTDSHWRLLIFSNGSIKPPDDVRLAASDTYATLGIGLTETV